MPFLFAYRAAELVVKPALLVYVASKIHWAIVPILLWLFPYSPGGRENSLALESARLDLNLKESLVAVIITGGISVCGSGRQEQRGDTGCERFHFEFSCI